MYTTSGNYLERRWWQKLHVQCLKLCIHLRWLWNSLMHFLTDSRQCKRSPGALLADLYSLSCHCAGRTLQGTLLLVSDKWSLSLNCLPQLEYCHQVSLRGEQLHSARGLCWRAHRRFHVLAVTWVSLYPTGTLTGSSTGSCFQRWQTPPMGWFKTSSTLSTGKP